MFSVTRTRSLLNAKSPRIERENKQKQAHYTKAVHGGQRWHRARTCSGEERKVRGVPKDPENILRKPRTVNRRILGTQCEVYRVNIGNLSEV